MKRFDRPALHWHCFQKIAVILVFMSFGAVNSFCENCRFFMAAGPNIMINTDSTKKSAPSPIMVSGGVGADFFEDKLVNFQTKLSFFTNYYIWDGEDAQPAEVENRTATGLSFMLDLCAGHTWRFGKNSIQGLGGLGCLFRYGIRSHGVSSSDLNPLTGSDAGDDVKDINRWFFKKMNWAYPELGITYMRHINDFWNVGLETRAYFPLGSLVNGDGFDSMIFSLAIKMQLPDFSTIKAAFKDN